MEPGTSLRVKAHALNLRSQPRIADGNRIALLSQGHLVTYVDSAPNPEWCKVATSVAGTSVTGFVAQEFLELASTAGGAVPSVHLPNTGVSVTRTNKAWAYALTEPAAPRRTPGGAPSQQQLLDIVNWLDVEKSTHHRFAPTADTYCNIYAYDYCYLAGVYLPRVWWTGRAIHDWLSGRPVQARYGVTVGELNANDLFDWLAAWGDDFGWTRLLDKSAVQDAANDGKVVVMSGVRTNRNLAGHITAVVPEHGNKKAIRDAQGAVKVPLQSQAGRNNKKFHTDDWGTGTGNWSDRGFWVHD